MNLSTFWKTYGAHAVAYIASSLVTVLGLVVHYGPFVPQYGVLAAGIAGILLTAIHQIQTAVSQAKTLPPPAPSATRPTTGKQAGRASPALLVCVSACAAALLIGCSTLSNFTSNSASASAVQAAIDLAVGTTIQATAHTPAEQAAQAQQIITVTQDVEGAVTGNTTTLALLDAALQKAITAANLPPPDKAAAMILAQTVQSIILQQIQGVPGTKPVLTATQTVAITTVLNDVIQAASFYNVHATAAMRADMAQ